MFTAHNILLPNGRKTIPDSDALISESGQMKSVSRFINLLYRGDYYGKSIVDLGCLEGGYTVEFAKMGMISTGIEVRSSNIYNCKIVESEFSLGNLRFIQDDAWNLERYGVYDVVYCSGLLYHLDRPLSFLKMISRCARDAVIIHTHFTPNFDSEVFRLSSLVESEGLSGRWYLEHDIDDVEELDRFRWTSWSNKKSFWLERKSILQAINDVGFNIVMEQFDWLEPNVVSAMSEGGYYESHSRGLFVGVKR